MAPEGEQLPLPIGHAPRYGRDDFIAAPSNAAALAFIESWPAWPAPLAVLVGPEGTGKSHLAHLFAAASRAPVVDAAALPERLVAGQHAGRALAVEDCDRASFDERLMFHLVNRVRGEGGHLLLTARRPPDAWGLRLPDLISRLRAAPLLELAEPDDDLLRALFQKLFRDRQLAVDPAVIAYAVLRLERSCAAVRDFVERLDLASLAERRPITRAVVAALIARGGDGQES